MTSSAAAPHEPNTPTTVPRKPRSSTASPATPPAGAFEKPKHSNGSTPITLALELSPEQVDVIAGRVAELLAEQQATELERLLTVDELAVRLATTSEWVRRHQAGLGAFRLSDGGGRNPIRFRPSDVERFLSKRRLRPPGRAGDWRTDPDWAVR